MSQKTNPISLRLQNSNKHFESCWYSDFFYNTSLEDESRFRVYVKGILSQAARSKALPSIQSQYKRYCTLLFFLDPRAERHKREFALKLSREPIAPTLLPKIRLSPNKKRTSVPSWEGFAKNIAQDILCTKNLSQKERYDCLLEKGLKQKRLDFIYKGLKEYVYNYAIKDSFLDTLPLRGLESTKCNVKDTLRVYDSIINPRQKHNFTTTNHDRPRTTESTCLLFRKAPSRLGTFTPEVSTESVFPLEGGFRGNLFRRLVVDRHFQSIQNRLCYSFVKDLYKQFRDSNVSSAVSDNYKKHLTLFSGVKNKKSLVFNQDTDSFVPHLWRNKSIDLFRHVELTLNLFSGNFGNHTIYPIRALSPYQNPGFLIDSIAYLLQRKSSFRQIKDELFRELDQIQIIKGARLSCAGRFGGRSKKAQKAKTQSAQWGETSLTVFSSHLSFASRSINTAYGKVGVKLWLCYKT